MFTYKRINEKLKKLYNVEVDYIGFTDRWINYRVLCCNGKLAGGLDFMGIIVDEELVCVCYEIENGAYILVERDKLKGIKRGSVDSYKKAAGFMKGGVNYETYRCQLALFEFKDI